MGGLPSMWNAGGNMSASIVILNARIRALFAPAGTTAIAIKGDRIMALGDVSTMRAHIGPETHVIDAGGRELMPGFIESHLHLFMGGATLSMLNLGSVFGFEAVQAAFAAFIRDNPGDDILFGYAVNYVIFGEDRRPDRHILDRIVVDRPLCLLATDLHCAWANTRALEMAGILHGADVGPGARW
ncbi:hypothetical protein A7A09_000260 [Paracoccus methylarcula]|uniref:Amidohydrolase 3 domain-containing protein n=1 Tax=Paracoccus methylarcula TaxID=72022 RepID=A0A3R7LJB0_9RHOB|nr:hypothetical protein A7A09_000260 [Paracoccus methylarcula]